MGKIPFWMDNLTIYHNPPSPDLEANRAALAALTRERSILPALAALHAEMGDVFHLALPGFQATVLAGPEANRFLLAKARHSLRWRNPNDPVTQLLRHGLLVEDGENHDQVRQMIAPALHRRKLGDYVEQMWRCTDKVCEAWDGWRSINMLEEMRRIALLIIMETLFRVDFYPHLERLLPAIKRTIAFISPGIWLLWKNIPRPGYAKAIRGVDVYLYELIATRRASLREGDDLLALLLSGPNLTDGLIRDQLLTMLIAGHDTVTAHLAWTLYVLGKYPLIQQQAQAEVDDVLGKLPPQPEQVEQLIFLDQVISESLRLYPPIHAGNRLAMTELEFNGCQLPLDQRLLYSIYATHRDEKYWPEAERFDPQRFVPGSTPKPYTYVPFGGGPRNCIGAAFARVESKVVLARILQRFEFSLLSGQIRQSMGATLEPRPGVMTQVQPRK